MVKIFSVITSVLLTVCAVQGAIFEKSFGFDTKAFFYFASAAFALFRAVSARWNSRALRRCSL